MEQAWQPRESVSIQCCGLRMSSQYADKPFEDEVKAFHSEIQDVFGSIPEPVINSTVQSEGVGGEVPIDLYIGHIRTSDSCTDDSLRSKYSKHLEGFYYLVSLDSYGKGNVHFSDDKRFSKNHTFQTGQRIAGYLKKYFTKDDASEFGENRYSFSKGIPEPRKERFYIPIMDYTFELVEQLIQEVTGKKIKRIFDISDNPRAELWLSTF